MRPILSDACAELLSTFAGARTLLAFDFDGTLAPTVPDRDKATMRAATRELFTRVCRIYPCFVISGRRRQDVLGRLGKADVRAVIGNHGIEPSPDMQPFERQIASVRSQLEGALGTTAGIEVEDKRYSLALHYRRSPMKAKARRAIQTAIARLSLPMRIVPGKLVVNVAPRGAPHKGDALVRLWKQERAERAIFLGDDVTDEDVFHLGRPEQLLGIRVGTSRSSAARYYLRNQREVDVFLTRLCDLRDRGG